MAIEILLLIESRDEGVLGMTVFRGSELDACRVMVNDVEKYRDILISCGYLEYAEGNVYLEPPIDDALLPDHLLRCINNTFVDGDSYSAFRFHKLGLPYKADPVDDKVVHARMAKPSEADFEAMLDFFNGLDERCEGWLDAPDDLGEWVFNTFDDKVGYVWRRVLWAYDTLLNNCADLDPDKSYLDFNAEIKEALTWYRYYNKDVRDD